MGPVRFFRGFLAEIKWPCSAHLLWIVTIKLPGFREKDWPEKKILAINTGFTALPVNRPELVSRLILTRDSGKERPEDIVNLSCATLGAAVEREEDEANPIPAEPVVKGAAEREKGRVTALFFFTVEQKGKEI